jgi:hypothetical protein
MRDYDGAIQRWLTRDPAGEAGGLNLYEYDDNDPINESDPSGLDPGEGELQAQGRVTHRAIQEFYMQQGAKEEAPVNRFANGEKTSGFADLKFEGKLRGEIGPASPTGVRDKLAQLSTFRGTKGELFLYKQTATTPVEGDTIEFVRLTPAQGTQILDELKAGTLAKSDIWTRATQLADGKVLSTTVSKTAAERAGRVFYRGKPYDLNYASAEGEAAAGAESAGETAAANPLKKILPAGPVAGAVGVILTSPSTAQAAEFKPLMSFGMDDVVAANVELTQITRPSTVASLTFLSIFINETNLPRQTAILRVMTRRELEELASLRVQINEDVWLLDIHGQYTYSDVRAATPEEVSEYRRNGAPLKFVRDP